MRAVLEFLGLVPPDPARRSPLAVPAWGRYVFFLLPLTAAVLAVLAGLLVGLAIRALSG